MACTRCNRTKVCYKLEVEGETYYFCDEDCAERWTLEWLDNHLEEVK